MTWARLQSTPVTQATGATTETVIFGSSVAVGSLVVVRFVYAQGATIVSVTDSGSNTYTSVQNVDGGPGTIAGALYYTKVTTGGTLTVTVTYGATTSTLTSIQADEYSGAAGTFSVANSNGVSSPATTTTPSAGTVTWTGNALVLAGLGNASMNAVTAGAGFTLNSDTPLLGGTAFGLATEDLLNSSLGTIAGAFTVASGGTVTYSATVAAFQTTGDSLSFTVAPTTSTNAQSVVYTLTGTATSWTGGTTFGISGVTGASITSQSCNAGTQVGTVTVLLDNTHTGTITFTDSTDAATATTAVTLALPGIPVSPSCTPGNNQNVLNWSAPSNGGLLATYNVYRGTTPGGESGTPLATGITLLTYTDSTAMNGTTYYYKIGAVNATGVGTHSSEVSGTPAATSFTVAPSTSTNAQSVVYTLTGTATSWVNGTTTFSISGVTGASITAQSVNNGAQTASVTVLLDNTHTGTLTFSNNTDAATATSAVTLALPGIPTSPACTPGNNQNVLTWVAPVTGGLLATYNVYRGTTPGGESGTPLATGITLLTYTDSTAMNGTTYYYKIAAVNATGVGTHSSEVSGTPSSTGVGNLTAAQALAALAVLTRSIQPPFLNKNNTGISIATGNTLVIPLTAANLAAGAALINGADSNNIYLGLYQGCPLLGYGTSGSAVGSAGVSGGGAGGLTAAQFLAVLAVMARTAQTPFLTQNQTGIYVKANQLVIPITSYNTTLGSTLTLSVSGSNVLIGLRAGDPSNGMGA